jgi:hypothetical protein
MEIERRKRFYASEETVIRLADFEDVKGKKFKGDTTFVMGYRATLEDCDLSEGQFNFRSQYGGFDNPFYVIGCRVTNSVVG